jgi:subtilisin-like proprotein convertase family protein
VKGPRIIGSRLAGASIVLLLLVAPTGAVLAGGEPPAPPAPPGEHLLLVPGTAEGAAAVAKADVRVVARYESFALVEAAGADERRLREAGAQRRDDMRTVTTAAGGLDPAADRASLAGKEAPDRDEVLALVQFVGPPKDAWLERLRATGARIVTYQPENAYVVHASAEAVERLAGLVGTDAAVRAVTPVTAADKVEAGAGTRYALSTVAGEAGADARADAAAAGRAVATAATVGAVRTQYLELSAGEVAGLARDPAVVAIEPDAAPTPSDERAAQIVAGNLGAPAFTQPSGPGYLDWLSQPSRFPSPATFGFAIDVTDTGFDNGADPPAHPDFRELGNVANPDRVAYLQDYTSDANAEDCAGHGTNVASIATGYNANTGAANEDSSGFNHGLGVAPLARVGASKIFNCAGAAAGGWTPATVASNAYTGGARISNNSWGTGTAAAWGEYSTRSQQYDQVVRDAQTGTALNQQLVEVFAAGNDGDGNPGGSNEGYGSISAEATAKNVITVGAAESVRLSGTDLCGTPDSAADSAREVADFSSRGPTDDGRLKPDLVAPGTHVTGAAPLHSGFNGTGTCGLFNSFYSIVSGSSQAAPQVSGAAALIRDWYTRTEGAAPSPALTKALLINTASDLAGGQNGKGDAIAAGPNDDQGWGRVNVGAAIDATPREYRDQQDLLATEGGTSVHTYAVPDTSKPVKVTLVWTDAPGNTTGNAWVNNLDLEVATGGQAYKGNVFGSGGLSRAGGAADVRNNVESVYLPAGTSGRFSVTVRATTLAGDGVPGAGDATDQDFGLVVSNAVAQGAAPVLVHQSTTIVGGDGDGALESDEPVELVHQVRNAGTGPATGLSATLSAGGGLAVTQGSSAYPGLAGHDSLSSNTPRFAAHLANAATCGADVPATLAITSSSETQTIPFTVPTGAPGALQNDSSAQVPVAIPDDSAAGVSSSVFVGSRGRIKDLNVTIPGTLASPGIDHGWVGDLVIDITGPDGTTVRLADHPGGPDNNGKDFAGTVFDDQAVTNIAQGTAPYTGNFKPQNDQLSRFNGKSRRGWWTLRVRDLFEGDTGTVLGWGVASQKALCNIDTTPPDTVIAAAPANPTASTTADFSFASDDPGATFECQLDGAPYFDPCGPTATYAGLALGSHSLRVRAVDGSDNEDATAASHTWTIAPDAPVPPAASFVLAPVEERLADALAGRLKVLAACASACRASVKLTVSARTARRLGLGKRAVTLGSSAKRRSSAGTVAAGLRLTKAARKALRGRALTKATIQVTLTEGGRRLTIKREISLRRTGVLKRVASRGLRLWAACERRCGLSAELTVTAREARRLGLKPGRAKRYRVASGRTTAVTRPKLLVVKVRRDARKKVARARRMGATLEAIAGTAPNPRRTAKLSMTLRR